MLSKYVRRALSIVLQADRAGMVIMPAFLRYDKHAVIVYN